MPVGVTSTGFVKRTVDEVRTQLVEAVRQIDPHMDTSSDVPMGQILGIVAAAEAEGDDATEAVYSSAYPGSAGGLSLDQVCAITGVVRLAPRASTVSLTLSGSNGTVVPAGSIAQDPVLKTQWVTSADSAPFTSGTAVVTARCSVTGPVEANGGTITEIVTPVSGWTSVTNPLDATPGRNLETDPELRLRRLETLAVAGNAAVEAIRTSVLQVTDVETAYVFENVTDVTDVDGVPPHAVEVVVDGGDDDELAQAIFKAKAAGIRAFGDENPADVIDSQGIAHDIRFTRPDPVPIKVKVIRTTNSDYPVDGDTQIKTRLRDYVRSLASSTSPSVIRTKLYDIVFNVSGVVDVTTLEIGLLSGAFGTANIAISTRQKATLEIADITVTS